MENATPETTPSLYIDTVTRNYLAQTSRWAKFLAIVGFVMCGLLIILAFFIGAVMSTVSSMGQFPETDDLSGSMMKGMMSGTFTTILYIVIALVYLIPCLFLFRFADKMQVALRSDHQLIMTHSFGHLKSLFKFMGIMTIVVLAMYALGLLLAMIFTLFK